MTNQRERARACERASLADQLRRALWLQELKQADAGSPAREAGR